MVVTCIANSSKQSPQLFQSIGYSEQKAFQVKPGTEYVVYAMALLGLNLVLLLRDETGQPNWYPASQFKVANPHLAPDWAYDIVRKDGRGLRAIWGYKTMIEDRNHNDGLLGREPAALEKFSEAAAAMPLEMARNL